MSASLYETQPVLLVASTGALAARVPESLASWRISVEAVGELDALARVEAGLSRVVLCENTPGLRTHAGRLRAAGALVILLGTRDDHAAAEEDFASRPSELVSSVFSALGRLRGLDDGASLERVNHFAQVIATQFNLPDLIRACVAQTRELCEADGASLLLLDAETGELCFDAIDGSASDKLERIRLPAGRGVASKVAVECRARLVPDVSSCTDFDASFDRKSGFQTGSIIAAPLVLGPDVLGVLMAVRSVHSRPFGPRHLERLVQISPHVAISVHNVQITSALRVSQAEVLAANSGLEQKVRDRTDQISRAKQEWEKTFDAIAEPIALMDGFTVRRANSAYARKVGMRIQDVPGKKCHQMLAGKDAPCAGCPLTLARGAKLQHELEFPDGENPRPAVYRFSGYWMSDDPRDATVVVHYQDLTASRSLADRLRESERLAAVGQLASGAAHEINNPLGFVNSNLRSLRGLLDELRQPLRALVDAAVATKEGRATEALELLRDLSFDEQSLEDGLEMIDESLDGARRVAEIVKGLRELSRLEIGKREPACVNASVTRAVRSEFGDKAGKQVVLELKATHHADIAPLQLDQVLTHIVKNARQALGETQRVYIETSSSAREVIIQVRDEGVGIIRENLRRVFEPFFTTRGVGKGIGLGLTAAYGIVKRTGGDIEVESEGPGKGATFTVRLARAPEVATELKKVSPPAEQVAA